MNDDPRLDDPTDLDRFEREIMGGLKPDTEDPVLDLPPVELPTNDPGATPAPAPAAAAAPAAPAPAATPAAPAPAPAAPQEDKGDPRAALRASRRAERAYRERLAEVEAENARLREQAGVKAPGEEVDPDVQGLIDDVPTAAPVIKKLVDRVKQLEQTAAPTAPAPAPAFVPETLPPELQVAVEQVPQLEDWQHDPDQTAWRLAKRTDGVLSELPAWKDKSPAERFAEVVRRVSAELGTPKPNAPPPASPKPPVIDHTGDPESLSDLRGGVVPTHNDGPDFSQMKSDDEILSALDWYR